VSVNSAGLFVEARSRYVIFLSIHLLFQGGTVRLKGCVALVSGAAMGIGKGIASLFAQEGAKVIAVDINAEAGNAAAEEIRAAGGQCVFRRTDVSVESDVQDAVAATQKEFGQAIDVLANVAGIAHESPAHLLDLADWDRILKVNLTSMFLCAKHVLPGMRAAKRGSIVNITSVQGLFGFPGYPHYAASKGGIISLTRQMAREYARNGIRVNCIAPGTVETPMNIKVLERVPNPAELRSAWERMHPMGRIGQPLDIAWGALYLSCDESSWVTGQCLSIDGGVSCTVLPE
jgi:NAD(P)-dependent dehydrogenase (short-subunit alcohol dehydrogenase family)